MRKLLVLAGVALIAVLVPASPAAANLNCNGAFTGSVSGDVVVKQGTTCTLTDATVQDDIEVLAGGILFATNTTVGDDVQIHRDAFGQLSNSRVGDSVNGRTALTVLVDSGTTVGGEIRTRSTFLVFVFDSTVGEQIDVHDTPAELSGTVNICGNTVQGGKIHVLNSGTDILVGDADPDVKCAGNTVQNGDIEIEHNFTDVELVVEANNVLKGDLEVSDNRGPSDKRVTYNIGGEELECKDNETPFTAAANTGWMELEGQCAEQPDSGVSQQAGPDSSGIVPAQ
jgi:hypothetical protein